jgi:hypothetical protein
MKESTSQLGLEFEVEKKERPPRKDGSPSLSKKWETFVPQESGQAGFDPAFCVLTLPIVVILSHCVSSV